MKRFSSILLSFLFVCCLSQPQPDKPVVDCNDSPFGFHTARAVPSRLTGTPRAEIDKETINFYEDAQYIGVAWERPGLYCHWILIQPQTRDIEKGIFHWELNDNLYKGIPESMCILGNIGLPERVVQGSWELTEPVEDYITFVKTVVERYDGDGIDDMPGLCNPVVYWQVENEPDFRGDWQSYAQIQMVTYDAVKEACPECQVLMGGMSGGGIPTFERFYRPILVQFRGAYIDIFDFHWYGNALSEYRGAKPVYEVIRNVLDQNGFTETDIWITETGTYSGSPFHGEQQSEADQAQDVVKRYVYFLSLGVEKVFWAWGLQEGFKHNNGFFDHTGFIYDGEYTDDLGKGEKKLSYYTYKKMTEILSGCTWDTVEIISESDVCIFRVPGDGKYTYVVWVDYYHLSFPFEGKEVSLNVGSDNVFRLTEAVPHVQQGIDVDSYETAFTTSLVQPEDGIITITVGKNPVFCEEVDQNLQWFTRILWIVPVFGILVVSIIHYIHWLYRVHR